MLNFALNQQNTWFCVDFLSRPGHFSVFFFLKQFVSLLVIESGVPHRGAFLPFYLIKVVVLFSSVIKQRSAQKHQPNIKKLFCYRF